MKQTTQLQESTKYMNRPIVNHILDDNWISRTFKEAIRRPDLQQEPITTEIAILKAREIFGVVPRLEMECSQIKVGLYNQIVVTQPVIT